MNRDDAELLLNVVTIEDLRLMIKNAQESITDWKVRSKINRSLSIGATFNILTEGILEDGFLENRPATNTRNLIWEFGEYLPDNKRPNHCIPMHQEPNLIDFGQ